MRPVWRKLRYKRQSSTLLSVNYGVEDWHEIGATDEPSFANSFVNFGGGFETAAFYKDPFGRVHLKGLVKDGVGASPTIFTLPVGYRPAATLAFEQRSSLGATEVRVDTSGNVVPQGANDDVRLDGISFRAEDE